MSEMYNDHLEAPNYDPNRVGHGPFSIGCSSNNHQLPSLISTSSFSITLKFTDVCYRVKLDSSRTSTAVTTPKSTNLKQIICGGGDGQTTSTQTDTINTPTTTRPSSEKKILQNITGTASPGEILAILGPSGSGKSTLLNILAGRLHNGPPSQTGSIQYNDKKFTKQIQKRTGFVTQDDVLYPHLTVRETLIFCALLRLPQSIPKRDKIQIAESVISELDLSKCENTVIGNSFIRGISGGERKRVSIAHEMLVNPSLLILDEPTSGLDSTAAYRVVKTLGGLARKGKTVITSVHQPSSRVFQMFDSVLVLCDGRGVYFGKGTDVMRYFDQDLGFRPSFPMNPADFLLDLANGVCHNIDGISEGQKPNVKQTLFSSYNDVIVPRIKASCSDNSMINTTSSPRINVTASRTSHDTHNNTTTTDSSKLDAMISIKTRKPKYSFRTLICTWFNQLSILVQRSLKERKHESFNSLRILQVIAAACLSGAMWWHSDYHDIQDRLGLLFFISIFWGVFPSFNAVFAFPQDRTMLIKERASGMYSLSSYFMARIIGDIPMELILPTIFITLTYWMTGLRPELGAFLLTTLVMLGYVLVAQGLGLALGAFIMDAKRASTIVTITMLAFVLTGGFYVHKVPGCLSWIKYASITFYAYRLLINVQYENGNEMWNMLGCHDQGKRSGDFNVVASCKFIEEDIAGQINPLTSIGVMLIMFVGYRLLAYLALKRMKM